MRAALLGFLFLSLGPLRLSAQDLSRGKAVYEKWCAGCHGETGAGDGEAAAFMLPRPRDFTRAVYQVRTTPSGELPTDADLRRVIDEGMPGTAMPAWRGRISDGERDEVIAYLKSFSKFFEGAAPTAVAGGEAPGVSAEGVTEGRQVFEKLECFKCHGQAGRGDGPSAPTLTDDWDHPIRPADLSESWNFNGGASVEQIYLRLRTGIDGTPMPSFTDVIESGIITDQQLWRVAQYVRSLSAEQSPRVREVIRAVLVPGPLPAGPDDSAWVTAEPSYVPLVGQIIVKPRWFAPSVDGVWVRAMHDGERLALHLTWHEPSQSPDPSWDEWLGRIVTTMTDADGPIATSQGPDRFHVQFALRPADDLERPYFLGGDRRRPAYQWRWTSQPDELVEGTAQGLARFTPRSGEPEAAHVARFEDGAWRLQITRPLASGDTMASRVLAPGQAIPIAFFAADGSNGEDEVRGAVSAWYVVYLDLPTPPTVYLTPAAAMLLTAGLGLIVVRRAQRRERGAGST